MTARKGLKGITATCPDLVILDIKMPRMDGMEILGHLRENSGIPVIFLTSKDEEVDEVIGLRMGADDYITKPFSQRLLDRAHPGVAAPRSAARQGYRR